MVAASGWQPPLPSPFAGVAPGVNPVLVMKEHLGWSQTEKRWVLSPFFVADMSCMFIAALRQRVSAANRRPVIGSWRKEPCASPRCVQRRTRLAPGNFRDKPSQETDGSTVLYLSPQAPAGKTKNWLRRIPDRGYFTILRLYGPTEAAINKSWKPGDIERMQ